MKSRIAMMAISLVLLSSSSASAAGLQGTFTFTGVGGLMNGTNLANSTIFTFTNYSVIIAGTGDFSGVTVGTNFSGPAPFPPGILDKTSPATMAGFQIINPNFGSFVASNQPGNQVVVNNVNNVVLNLSGVFTPQGTLISYSPTPANISVNLFYFGTGREITQSFFTVTVVPEPSTYALGAVSTCAIGALARRKRRMASNLA